VDLRKLHKGTPKIPGHNTLKAVYPFCQKREILPNRIFLSVPPFLKRPSEYPRYVTAEFEPFDPLELAKETEKTVTRRGHEGLERKYEDFYATARALLQ